MFKLIATKINKFLLKGFTFNRRSSNWAKDDLSYPRSREARTTNIRNKSLTGFTLLEIIIALVILAIGLIAVAYMVNSAISSNREAKLLTQAVILAQDKLEELKGVAYDNLAGGSDISGDYSRVWTVQTDASKAMKTVTLTVSWNSGTKSVTFVTKIAQ